MKEDLIRWKWTLRRISCLLLRMLLVAGTMSLGGTAFAKDLSNVRLRIDQVIPDPEVGACLLVIRSGETVLKTGYGLAELGSQRPCTAATNFRMGSVSKQFTASAILSLVDDEMLSTRTSLGELFHESPKYWDDITVHHLLNHTSGIPDYRVPAGTSFQLSDQNVLTQLLDTKAALFAPGEQWQYCNAGYVLLGLIVEQTSGKSFHRYVRERFFEPLGMANTCIYYRGWNEIRERAMGHVQEGAGWVIGDQSPTSALRGDGSLYSSLNDMEKWIRAVLDRNLLSPPSTEAMFRPHNHSEQGYGYGWYIDTYKERKRFSHGGATRGFRTYLELYPDERSAILIQVNTESSGLKELSEQIAEIIAPE